MSFLKPDTPPKSEAEVKHEETVARETRQEEYKAKKRSSAGRRRRMGRSLLISDDERGVSNTLG